MKGDEVEGYRMLCVRASKVGTGRTEKFSPLKHTMNIAVEQRESSDNMENN